MKYLFCVLTVLLISASTLHSQIPYKLSYQGLLTSPTGALAPDGSYDLKFDIYNNPTVGTLRFTEMQTGVSVVRGTFSVSLGSVTTLTAIFSEPLYVEVTALSGPGIGAPVIFSPRSELTSAPYALGPWVPAPTKVTYMGGNVGIGTTNPSAKLHVDGGVSGGAARLDADADNVVMDIRNVGGTKFGEIMTANGLGFDAENSNDIIFRGNDNERMRITNAGNVGIGTTSPRSILEVLSVQPFGVFDLQSTGTLGYGTVGTGYNLIRTGANSWTANQDGFNNGGQAIYGTVVNGLNFVTVPSTGASNQSFTDAQIAANIRMKIGPDGNVGIGTTNPIYKLDVNGTTRVQGYDFALGTNDGRAIGSNTQQRALVHGDSDILKVNYDGDFEGGTLVQGAAGTANLFVSGAANGNVGIGTTTPGRNLEVVGFGMAIKSTGGVFGPSVDIEHVGGRTFRLLSTGSSDASGAGKFAVWDGTGSQYRIVVDSIGNVGIGTSSPGASNLLELSSTTKGFVLPRLTKTQRDAIASPVAGMMVYQTDNTPGLRVYNGTNWMRFTETAD